MKELNPRQYHEEDTFLTVKELREYLSAFPDDSKVVLFYEGTAYPLCARYGKQWSWEHSSRHTLVQGVLFGTGPDVGGVIYEGEEDG